MDRGPWGAIAHEVAAVGHDLATEPPPLFSSVQSLSRVQVFATPWTAAHQASLSITSSRIMSCSHVNTQTHVHRVGDAIQPSHPLLSPSPSAFNLSQHQGLFK